MKTKLAILAVVVLSGLGVLYLRIVRPLQSIAALQSFALDVLHEQHPQWRLGRVGDDAVSVQVQDRIGHLYLDNIFRIAGSDRARAKTLLEKSAQTLAEQLESANGSPALPKLDDVKARLRPMLVPSDYAKRYDIAARNFVANVVEALVIDDPHATRYVRSEDLLAWQVDLDSLLVPAERALWQSSQTLELKPESPADASQPGKFITIATKDGYDAARLALRELRDALGKQLGYPFFAAVPNRDFLVAWSSDYAFANQFSVKVREDFGARSYPVSPQVFRVDAEQIQAVP